jgi:hypothetical protein
MGSLTEFRLFILENYILIWDFGVLFENYNMPLFSTRGNDFIAGRAYAELFKIRISQPNQK